MLDTAMEVSIWLLSAGLLRTTCNNELARRGVVWRALYDAGPCFGCCGCSAIIGPVNLPIIFPISACRENPPRLLGLFSLDPLILEQGLGGIEPSDVAKPASQAGEAQALAAARAPSDISH